MCGRYGTTMTMREAARRLGIDAGKLLAGETRAIYNAAPGTAQLTAIGQVDDPADLELTRTCWGFLPSWQTNPSKSPINMRIESSTKRYWNKAFLKRRCVVPANWWYEWRREDGAKQPYAIRPVGDGGFFFAGVWSVAKSLPADHALHGVRTFAIATKPASVDLASIHTRMPIALDDATAQRWLEQGARGHEELSGILASTELQRYESWPVSSRVNRPENDDPALLDALG